MISFTKFCQRIVILLIICPVARAETVSRDSISPNEAAIMQTGNKAIIVDVREDNEWKEHHILGAIHIPLGELTQRLPELQAHKDRPIITQCKGGRRSAQAQTALKSAGFSKVYNLEGGIQAWDKAGLTTE